MADSEDKLIDLSQRDFNDFCFLDAKNDILLPVLEKELLEKKRLITSISMNIEALGVGSLRRLFEFSAQLLESDQQRGEATDLAPPSGKAKAQWAERTTGREVTPIDWIKMHYGRWIDGEWDPDGLTQADISRNDRKLYDAYIARIRRLPEENLHLPKTPKPRIDDPTRHLEDRRVKRRESYRRTGR